MAKHKSQDCEDVMDEMVRRLHFRKQWKKGDIYFLYPPEREYPAHLIHVAPQALIPLLTYLKRYERWKKSIDTP